MQISPYYSDSVIINLIAVLLHTTIPAQLPYLALQTLEEWPFTNFASQNVTVVLRLSPSAGSCLTHSTEALGL